MIKYNLLNEDACDNYNCSFYFKDLFFNCLYKLKSQKSEMNFYHKKYKKIFDKSVYMYVYIYSLHSKSEILIDIPNKLNFIINNGLKFYSYIKQYLVNIKIDENNDFYIENIINETYNYLFDDNYGFSKYEIKNYINSIKYKITNILIILNCIAFISLYFFILVCTNKLFYYEKKFLNRLINFNSPNFENYFKHLDDLRKKIRTDSDNIESKNNLNNESTLQSNNNFEEKKK
jgi:hypothetical protein